ncbi:beta-galactoside-binding lectin-like [Gigantopelta aegis]|uniref:beta-galactoside-binding lectin-like n=1 Tax=Gigantopelta aegis TaxID=1735272 RepID=UPI001B88B567|nr:beta-galactoside-binding lectin-like [Gigantopelta aegis]
MTRLKAALPEPMRDGWEMVFNGTPTVSNKHFYIHIENSENVSLHMDVRFDIHNQTKIIELNSRSGPDWGTSVKLSSFPFEEGVPFKLCIKLASGVFKSTAKPSAITSYNFTRIT